MAKRVQILLQKPPLQVESPGPREVRAPPGNGVSQRQYVGKHQQEHRASSKDQKPHDSGGPPFGMQISEWSKPVKLVAKAAVLKVVEQGNDIDGNITVVKSEAAARELKACHQV